MLIINVIYLDNINYYLPRIFSKFRSFENRRKKKYPRARIFRVCLRREMPFPGSHHLAAKESRAATKLSHWSRKLFREAREKAAARNKSLAVLVRSAVGGEGGSP